MASRKDQMGKKEVWFLMAFSLNAFMVGVEREREGGVEEMRGKEGGKE